MNKPGIRFHEHLKFHGLRWFNVEYFHVKVGFSIDISVFKLDKLSIALGFNWKTMGLGWKNLLCWIYDEYSQFQVGLTMQYTVSLPLV